MAAVAAAIAQAAVGQAASQRCCSALPCRTEKGERGGRKREEREKGVNWTLTHFYSMFRVETQKMVNIKVVRNSIIYNFRFRRKLI